jgi:two-component system sensor histidine kinase PilS (NtrC family)
VQANGMQLRVRFVGTESTQSEVLAFLENMSRLREQAQQIKLAALGRLTANIAHEIRNPLSAISHAGELMREERRGELHERLLRIVLDNTQRLERIVSDILDLGRRDRVYREQIELRENLPSFVDQYLARSILPADMIGLELLGTATLCFDRSHFHQVLWNLLSNALRHSRRSAGSVRLLVRDAQTDGQVELHVMDDGEGVGDDWREQIFEPFFPLSIMVRVSVSTLPASCATRMAPARAAGAGAGADFRLLGRAVGC